MRAVSADFGAREGNLESELRLDLATHGLQLFAEKFLDTAATQANNMRMLLFQTGLVVMFFALEMSQIQLVHQSAFLEQLQGAIYGDAIEFGIFFLGHLIQTFGVQMQTGIVDQIEQQAPLARQANPALA